MDHKTFPLGHLSPQKKLAYHNVPIYPPGVPPRNAQMKYQLPYTTDKQHAPLNEESDEPLSLRTFVSKYAQSLPLQITVEKGHHGDNERHCIASGDTYYVHYVKYNKVALLQDASGMSYTIPLNSTVQFGPVFDPNRNPKEALRGFVFEQISGVIAQKSPPKVIRATKAHISSNGKSSIERDEMFVVQRTVHSTMRKTALQVYSITKKEQRLLESTCLGGFTTDPYAIRLHFSEIMEHFSRKFPLDVLVIFEDMNKPGNLPHNIMSEVSSLIGIKTETSIIVSTCWRGNETVPQEEQGSVEIPVDLPIKVRIIKPKVPLKTIPRRHSVRQSSTVQCTKAGPPGPCAAVKRKFEREGHELQSSDHTYERIYSANSSASRSQDAPGAHLPPSVKPKRVINRQQNSHEIQNWRDDSEQGKENDSQVYQTLHKRPQVQPHTYATCMPHHSACKNTGSKVSTTFGTKETEETVPAPSSSDRFRKLLSRVDMLEREVCALHFEVEKLKPKGGSRDAVSTYQGRKTPKDENIELLKTLSTKTVMKLLQVMNMSQYQKTFISQQINGDILSECDEKMLQEELGISNRLHCMRLLQIINGKKSLSSLLAEMS